MSDENKDRWYYGVRCEKCNSHILLFTGDGNISPATLAGGELTINCPFPPCFHQAKYEPEQMGHYRVTQ
jgi:hypothetical protein